MTVITSNKYKITLRRAFFRPSIFFFVSFIIVSSFLSSVFIYIYCIPMLLAYVIFFFFNLSRTNITSFSVPSTLLRTYLKK